VTVLRFRSPVVLPVHPSEWVRPPGSTDFRVTQHFDDVNPAFPGSPHNATDLGNFRCGDAVVAMEAGSAATIGPDQYGALGCIITHEGDVQTVYWHLNGFSIPRGNAVPVARGQQIGIVGDTGLGAVCHLHVELKIAGVKVDPEPYIFGQSLVIEDGMQTPEGLSALIFDRLGAGNNIRSLPRTGDQFIKRTTTEVEDVQVFGRCPGAEWTIGGTTGRQWWWIGTKDGEDGFVALPLLTGVRPTALGATVPPIPAGRLLGAGLEAAQDERNRRCSPEGQRTRGGRLTRARDGIGGLTWISSSTRTKART